MRAKPRYTHFRDEELALAVHASESGAFECLVERYQNNLFGFVLRLLHNEFDAEEVVQDTVIRAHDALISKYDEIRCRSIALRPWLFRIARNLALNRQRGRRSHAVLTNHDLDSLPGRQPGAADQSRSELLQMALEGLDGSDRELLDLRFFHELPYREIAAIVGGSDSALRGRMFRALRRLRIRLEELGYSQCNVKT